MTQTHQTLISLAILKSDLDDERRDYLSYIESLLLPLLKSWPDEPVTDTQAARQFEAEYGLRIPDRTLQLVLRRLARQGYLNRSHGAFHISKALPETNLGQKRAVASAHIDQVFKELTNYAKSEFGVIWTDDEAEETFLDFLDRFGVDYLRAYIFRTTLPEVSESAPHKQFILSSFVRSIYADKNPLFESVIVLIKGQMYGNALTCPDLEGLQKNFKRLTFYFDTPLLLNLLNLQGEHEFDSTTELVSMLIRLGGRVVFFDHTATELESVLQATANNLENPDATGRVVREVRRLGLKRGDITLKLSRYDSELRQFGVQSQRTPEYDVDLQIEESSLEAEINRHVKYKHPRALEFDINSIRSIFVLRRGTVPHRLEDARAVLVTNNDALSRAAFTFGQTHNSTREVSPVITDFSLANVAWLKSPMDAPNLPVKETLAACYAAMEPNAELWGKYLTELQRLEEAGEITADDHAVLRASGLSEKALMDLTLGDETLLRGDTVTEILGRVKKELSAEESAKRKEERRAHDATRSRLRSELERKKRLESKIDRISYQTASGIGWIVFVLVVLAVFLGMTFGSGVVPAYILDSILATAATNTLIFLAILWGLYSSVFGSSLRSIFDRWKRYMANAIRKRLKLIVGLEVEN
ncbi:hypothetical protein GN155_000055 [Alcanivorax sp. ZXX171]|nr:hypothetical protein [Alcanivorax sp. ZXX171]